MQLAADFSPTLIAVESQKKAIDALSSQLTSLGARVAALEKGAAKPQDDGVVSSDDAQGDFQRAKFTRSAAGKARLRSSSPAHAAMQRDARVRSNSAPSRPVSPPTSASRAPSSGIAEELVLGRLAGLTAHSTANRAWQSSAGSFPAGTPAPVEMVTLVVNDYDMLKYRDRGAADSADQAMSTAALSYISSKGKEMIEIAIRVKPPATRRRGGALSLFYKAISDKMPDVDITQKHRTKGRLSASTFLVERADADKDDY